MQQRGGGGPESVRDALAGVIGRRWFSYPYFVRQAPLEQRRGFSAVSRGRLDVAALVARYNLRVLYDDAEAVPGLLDVNGLQVGDVLFQEVPAEATWVRVDHGTLGRSEFAPLPGVAPRRTLRRGTPRPDRPLPRRGRLPHALRGLAPARSRIWRLTAARTVPFTLTRSRSRPARAAAGHRPRPTYP